VQSRTDTIGVEVAQHVIKRRTATDDVLLNGAAMERTDSAGRGGTDSHAAASDDEFVYDYFTYCPGGVGAVAEYAECATGSPPPPPNDDAEFLRRTFLQRRSLITTRGWSPTTRTVTLGVGELTGQLRTTRAMIILTRRVWS
jgi:hypothetical protein